MAHPYVEWTAAGVVLVMSEIDYAAEIASRRPYDAALLLHDAACLGAALGRLVDHLHMLVDAGAQPQTLRALVRRYRRDRSFELRPVPAALAPELAEMSL